METHSSISPYRLLWHVFPQRHSKARVWKFLPAQYISPSSSNSTSISFWESTPPSQNMQLTELLTKVWSQSEAIKVSAWDFSLGVLSAVLYLALLDSVLSGIILHREHLTKNEGSSMGNGATKIKRDQVLLCNWPCLKLAPQLCEPLSSCQPISIGSNNLCPS